VNLELSASDLACLRENGQFKIRGVTPAVARVPAGMGVAPRFSARRPAGACPCSTMARPDVSTTGALACWPFAVQRGGRRCRGLPRSLPRLRDEAPPRKASAVPSPLTPLPTPLLFPPCLTRPTASRGGSRSRPARRSRSPGSSGTPPACPSGRTRTPAADRQARIPGCGSSPPVG